MTHPTADGRRPKAPRPDPRLALLAATLRVTQAIADDLVRRHPRGCACVTCAAEGGPDVLADVAGVNWVAGHVAELLEAFLPSADRLGGPAGEDPARTFARLAAQAERID